jgi:hypothetical protein
MKITNYLFIRSLIIVCNLLFVICMFGLPSPALAAQATSSITVSVLVQGSFNLVVNTDSFDFARLAPGQTGEMNGTEGVAVTGTSSGGNPWYLMVSTVKPLTSGNNSIPNENFTWFGTSEGKGAWYGNAEKSFAAPTNTAYVSSVDEADQVSKVVNKFKFRLRAPEDTKPGSYTTTVMFTMTE